MLSNRVVRRANGRVISASNRSAKIFRWQSGADSDEVGHAFQSEAGRYSELMPASNSDAKPATWCIARAGRLG